MAVAEVAERVFLPPPARASFDVLPAERAFRVMGSDAHVLVWQERDPLDAPEDLLDRAEHSLRRLEQLWSRFIPTSDVCRINDADGALVPVAPETIALLTLANRAQEVTRGRFDATLLHELEAAGYDRSFDQLDSTSARAAEADGRRALGDADRSHDHVIVVDERTNTAAAPRGRAVDLGGIGKGRAADVVAAQLLRDGALGACVNLGGDIRIMGETPAPDGVAVAVEDPFEPGRQLTTVEVRNAAVATSARTRRCWPTDAGRGHHLIDTSTGRPASSGLAAVTVIGPTAAWAEVTAKAAFFAGPSADAGRGSDLPRLLVADDGGLLRRGGFQEFER